MKKNGTCFGFVPGPSPGHCSRDWFLQPPDMLSLDWVFELKYSPSRNSLSPHGTSLLYDRKIGSAPIPRNGVNFWPPEPSDSPLFLAYELNFQLTYTDFPLTARRGSFNSLPRPRPSPLVLSKADWTKGKGQHPFPGTRPLWGQERIVQFQIQGSSAPSKEKGSTVVLCYTRR